MVVTLSACKKENGESDNSVSACNSDKWGLCPDDQTYIRIGKIVESPTESESITIVNYDSQTYDLENWSLWDANAIELNSGEYSFPSGTIIQANGTLELGRTTLGFQINDSQETIILKDQSGGEIHRKVN